MTQGHRQDCLYNLWGLVQNENVGALFKNYKNVKIAVAEH